MGVIENMKEVADLVKQIGDIELNRKIVNLEKEIHELTRDKMRLETKLHEAEELLRKKQALKFKEPFYFEEGDEVPYCPACWSANDIAVHLHFVFDRTDATRWDCPHCKHVYMVEKDRSVRQRRTQIEPNEGGGPNSWMR
jgi:rubrerythrin